MCKLLHRWMMIGLVIAVPSLAAGQVAGTYADGHLILEMAAAAQGQFSGTLTLGGKQYPATARSNGQGIAGSFTAGGNSFAFSASLDGDTMTLTTGNTAYTLKRQSAPVNPLGAPPPANPLAAGASTDAPTDATGGSVLAGYTTEASTDSGKSLVTQKPNAASVQAALEATFPDLAKYFGNRPEIGRAYEDRADHKSGGATFGATLNGQPVKGFVSCKMNQNGGATVAVIFARADVSKADWNKLAAPAASSSPTGAGPAATDLPKLLGDSAQVIQFPDGTGSITLAEGWKTQAQSALDPIFITGPGDQNIFIGSSFTVQTHDSPLLKMMEQNEANSRRMGMRPIPRPPMFVAEFTDPVQAMADLNPQMNKLSESRGGPTAHLDKIISHQDIPSQFPNGKAAIIKWDVTRSLNGTDKAYRGIVTTQMAPFPSGGSWIYMGTGFTAPQSTFAKDQPIMAAMISSFHINQDVAAQRMQERNRQMQQITAAGNDALQRNHDQFMHDQAQRFAAGQAAHAEQMAGYQRHNDQWKADELQKSRNNADFVETIRGTRTVYDTQTGTTGTADLNYSTAVVNQLNQAALDPNRFVEIPLRDEMYPVTGK
jgi:hypothetical protein